jgi:hypothetical protein
MEFNYVSCMFNNLFVEVKLNQCRNKTFNIAPYLSCCHTPWVMHPAPCFSQARLTVTNHLVIFCARVLTCCAHLMHCHRCCALAACSGGYATISWIPTSTLMVNALHSLLKCATALRASTIRSSQLAIRTKILYFGWVGGERRGERREVGSHARASSCTCS